MLDTISNNLQDNVGDGIAKLGLGTGFSQWLIVLAILVAVSFIAILSYYITKFFVFRLTNRISRNGKALWIKSACKFKVFHLISDFVPLFIIYVSAPLLAISSLPYMQVIAFAIQRFIVMFSIFLLARILFAFLNSMEERYRHLAVAKIYSIKSYLQVVKLIISCITAILIVSILLNKSPAYFLTGLGAMTAVVLLVFKDSILGFVASIQLAAYDMVRIGDWIEMPNFGVNGTVIDISLNTIKARNFDNTIVTIPSYSILTSGVKNWRGMKEAGGRRIKRSISIDTDTIRFCDHAMIEQIKKLPLFEEKLNSLLSAGNATQDNEDLAHILNSETYAVSNSNLFRAYLETYLSQLPGINRNMTFMVRQLENTGHGLPIEIYLFASDTIWVNYERLQADIFDHIYAILPLFQLKAFQLLSGTYKSD